MAAGRLLVPGWSRALDSDGEPIAARVSLFDTGTDALAAVFADEALTTPIANPVLSNSAGRFPAIWASDASTYDWSVEAPYGPPGSPFTGTGLTIALAADVLAADAAEAAADNAVISASEAETANSSAQAALAEIEDIAANAPDAPSVANKLNRDGSNPDAGLLAGIGAVSSTGLSGATGGALVGNQLPAGSNLATQTNAQFFQGGKLMPSMFAGNAEQQFLRAIVEGGEVRNDGLGQTVVIPRGERTLTASFNLTNRVNVEGVNKRGSVLKASSGHTGPYMATVINGTGSTFDNALRDLTLNCNDVAGLGGVLSDAWQEGGGLRNVLIQKFRTYGVYLQSGFGGASTCSIDGAEIFGSGVSAATAGIYCEQIALDGGFLVHVTNTTITGDSGIPMSRGIEMENDSLHCHVVHFEECTNGIYLDGAGDSVLIGVTGATTVPTVVRIAPTFTGTLSMIGCSRQGSTNLVVDERTGGLGTINYDTDVRIIQEPVIALGSVVASGNFNGNLTTPNIDKSHGVTSITKGTAGVYTLTLARPGVDANSFAVTASSLTPGATVQVELLTASTVRLTNRDAAGNGADTVEVKFIVVRCA